MAQDRKPERVIVIVEDNPRFMGLIRSVVREFQLGQILSFADPYDAFEAMTQQHVDLAIIDLMMPRANGFQLADRIRHAEVIVNRVMPILLMTGHADLRNVQRAINHGIDDVLSKPFSPAQLFRRVSSLIERPRVYIKTRSGYFGPDRRRREDPTYVGPERRRRNDAVVVTGAMLSQMRHEAIRKYGGGQELLDGTDNLIRGPVTRIPVAFIAGAKQNVASRQPTSVPLGPISFTPAPAPPPPPASDDDDDVYILDL